MQAVACQKNAGRHRGETRIQSQGVVSRIPCPSGQAGVRRAEHIFSLIFFVYAACMLAQLCATQLPSSRKKEQTNKKNDSFWS
jgi:hypothetical protein